MASLHYPASKKKFLRKKFLIDKFFEGKEWTRFVVEFFFWGGGEGWASWGKNTKNTSSHNLIQYFILKFFFFFKLQKCNFKINVYVPLGLQ